MNLKVKFNETFVCNNFTKQMTMNALFVNIDEWSINRNTKLKYSWRFKGVHIESQNTLFSGSISIVLTIYSMDHLSALL